MYLFESDYLKIWWDFELNCLSIKRIGFSFGEEFKDYNYKLLEIIQARKVSKMITDVTEMKVVGPAEQTWFTQEYLPQAHAAGLNFMAIIPPASIVAKLSVTAVEKKSNGTIEMRYFATYNEAGAWIKTV
jgi:hypothetical protein